MNQRLWRIFAAIGILVPALLVTSLSAGAVAPDHPRWIVDGEQYVPRTDGEHVVWLDDRRGFGHPFDIYGAPANGGPDFVISDSDANKSNPDISDGVVVWPEDEGGCEGCRGDIIGIRLATGERFLVSAMAGDETRSTISGDWVAWVEVDQPTGDRLWVKNIATNDNPILMSQADRNWRIDLPSLDGTRLLWSEYLRSGPGVSQYNLKTVSVIDGGEPFVLDEGEVEGSWGLTDDMDLAGDLITWSVGHLLYVRDLSSSDGNVLISTTGSCPTTDGRYIFWEDFRNYDEDREREIELWGYDMLNGSNFPVALAPDQNHEYPHVDNGILVWQAITGSTVRDVFADKLGNVVPTYPVPEDDNADSASYIWFPEVGHALETEFKAFWDQSGGLPVFGFPMTEEFDELNPDTAEVYRVQYLERQRYEHHPSNAGTPYEVLLGRLGVTAAEQRGYLATEPFQPVPSGNNGDGCMFFSETGHTLCGRFLSYWEASGLEFGDEGVSFRESVALFGYPISEEFVDPETGFVSQYFERAIFEYHPENDGTQYDVLLRRLGVEELENRSWCGPQIPGC